MMKLKQLKKLENEDLWAFNIGWANNFEVTVVITPDIIASRKHRNPILGEYNARIEGQMWAGLFCAVGCRGFLFLPEEFDPDTVAHESYHLLDYMLDRLSVEQRDGELMAYHMGFLVGKVSDIYLKIKKLKDKKKALTIPETVIP